jgi:hypothetical protein
VVYRLELGYSRGQGRVIDTGWAARAFAHNLEVILFFAVAISGAIRRKTDIRKT